MGATPSKTLRTLTIESDQYSAQATFKRKDLRLAIGKRIFTLDLDVAAGCLGCDLTIGDLHDIRDWIDEALATSELEAAR
jgi:hypothetical protein